MTGGFETHVEVLLASGSRLGEIGSDIRGAFEPLLTEMDSLLSSGWSGQAASGFSEGWQEWLKGFGECLTALEEMSRLLGVTAHGYGSAESGSESTVLSTGVSEL